MEQHCWTFRASTAVAWGNQPACHIRTSQQSPFSAFETFSVDEARMGPAWQAFPLVRGTYSWFALQFLLTDLCSQVFLIATQQISQSKTPLVHKVIPVFDIITWALNDHLADITLPLAIRMVAARGRAMLNKYYGLTDESIVYWIAMCMSFCIHDHGSN